MITQQQIKSILKYNPVTGRFSFIDDTKKSAKVGFNHKPNLKNSELEYFFICIYGTTYCAHRLAWVYVYGSIDKNRHIDHINGDGLDNRIENLRLVSRSENQKNRKLNKNNKTGVPGIYKNRAKYRVEIKHNGKKINIGSYSDIFEAFCARKSAEIRYGFHANHGRR